MNASMQNTSVLDAQSAISVPENNRENRPTSEVAQGKGMDSAEQLSETPYDLQPLPLKPDSEALWLEVPKGADLTPMMAQYSDVKAQYPDTILFFRMGDFFEMFFKDAVTAAKALDITLTRRGQFDGKDIPMCGVPVKAYEIYVSRLVEQGFKVALCEQTESPEIAKARGGKTLVRRAVMRVVTAGTLVEEQLLDSRRHNYLACIVRRKKSLGIAWVDISTGDIFMQGLEAQPQALASALGRIEPREILVSEKLCASPDLASVLKDWQRQWTVLPESRFDASNTEEYLKKSYGVSTLEAFGVVDGLAISAGGALVEYLHLTQMDQIPSLKVPQVFRSSDVLDIDNATRRSLELNINQSGQKHGTLLSVLDQTQTAIGARTLSRDLAAPLKDASLINRRLDLVEFFCEETDLRQEMRALLGSCPDFERAVSRLSCGRGNPRDLGMIRDGLVVARHVLTLLSPVVRQAASNPALNSVLNSTLGGYGAAGVLQLTEHLSTLSRLEDLCALLYRALLPHPPMTLKDNDVFARGYSPTLDELRSLATDGERRMAALAYKYQQATGILSLKIKFNNIIGRHIDVPPSHSQKLMEGQWKEQFIHRQTLANSVRFTTVELAQLERKLSESADKAQALEQQLFEGMAAEVLQQTQDLILIAASIGRLDVATALADLATKGGYVRPNVTEEQALHIEGGRHPVLDYTLRADGKTFVPNSSNLDADDHIWLLTGPNMAGKSTFLRQNALLVIMAQMGSFVPADSATIGVVDKLFSRVGASDDLARGRSTFMVEMIETAAILNQATDRSLVILDEVGRGTATFDGLSIAWATVEHLHGIRCRALFATHYHELTALRHGLPRLSCHTMKIREWQGEIVLLHEVVAGTADRSYGIHVAQMAGLPKPVVARAREVLAILERESQSSGLGQLVNALPLFAFADAREVLAKLDAEAAAARTELDALSAAIKAENEAKEENGKIPVKQSA